MQQSRILVLQVLALAAAAGAAGAAKVSGCGGPCADGTSVCDTDSDCNLCILNNKTGASSCGAGCGNSCSHSGECLSAGCGDCVDWRCAGTVCKAPDSNKTKVCPATKPECCVGDLHGPPAGPMACIDPNVTDCCHNIAHGTAQICPKSQCCSGGARASARVFCCTEATQCCPGLFYLDPGTCAKAGEKCCFPGGGGVCPSNKTCCARKLLWFDDQLLNLKCCDEGSTCCNTRFDNTCCPAGTVCDAQVPWNVTCKKIYTTA